MYPRCKNHEASLCPYFEGLPGLDECLNCRCGKGHHSVKQYPSPPASAASGSSAPHSSAAPDESPDAHGYYFILLRSVRLWRVCVCAVCVIVAC